MQNMRLLEDIFVRDPYFVRAEKGWLLFLSHDKAADDSYEGVDVCFSADGVLWSEPQPALRQPVQNRTYWATEIHPWQGAWYMFVTLTGVMPGCGIDTPLGNEMIRGTWIFRSEKPEGPYKAWTEGPIQPMEHLTLDGTLYVSPEGKPYMVYCHEWLQVKDGTVEAVEMSADLKQAVSEPFVLFNASDVPWSTGMYVAEALGIRFDCTCRVTDGCFFFRDKSGALCMLWSTGNGRYETGIARSPSGRLEGPWEHEVEPIFTADGGHPMLVRSDNGEWLMALHAPNGGGLERVYLIPVTITEHGLTADLTREGSLR